MIDCGGGGGEDIFMEHAGNISNIFYNTQKSLFKVHYILFISFIHSFILLEGYSRYQNLVHIVRQMITASAYIHLYMHA